MYRIGYNHIGSSRRSRRRSRRGEELVFSFATWCKSKAARAPQLPLRAMAALKVMRGRCIRMQCTRYRGGRALSRRSQRESGKARRGPADDAARAIRPTARAACCCCRCFVARPRRTQTLTPRSPLSSYQSPPTYKTTQAAARPPHVTVDAIAAQFFGRYLAGSTYPTADAAAEALLGERDGWR